MNGWHAAWNDERGLGVACGHIELIAVPPVQALPADSCGDCLTGEGWIELRRCLICGHTGCCDSSPGRHARKHFERTGHATAANQSGGNAWGWCYVDDLLLSPDR